MKAAGNKISITLAPKIMEILEEFASEKGITKSAVVALAVEKYVREEGSRDGK